MWKAREKENQKHEIDKHIRSDTGFDFNRGIRKIENKNGVQRILVLVIYLTEHYELYSIQYSANAIHAHEHAQHRVFNPERIVIAVR